MGFIKGNAAALTAMPKTKFVRIIHVITLPISHKFSDSVENNDTFSTMIVNCLTFGPTFFN